MIIGRLGSGLQYATVATLDSAWFCSSCCNHFASSFLLVLSGLPAWAWHHSVPKDAAILQLLLWDRRKASVAAQTCCGSFVTYANSCHLDQHMQGPEGLRIILQASKLIHPNMLCAYDVTEPWNQQTCPVGWIWGFCGLACAEAPFRDVVGEVDEACRRKGSSPCDTVDSVQEPGHEPRIHEGWSVVSLITLWLDVLWRIDEPYTSKPKPIYPNRTWLLYASLRYLHSIDMPNGPIFVYAWHPGRLPSRRVGTWTSQACPRTFVRNTWLRIWRCCGMN